MSAGKSDGFTLFQAEESLLAEAETLQARLDQVPPDMAATITTLVDAYRRSIRQQSRLVKVSDRLQDQLANTNQELAKRKAEAEEALERLTEAQEQLVQTEKLASLGALVGGIAHEINTPVGIALSCASHLSDATGAMRRLFEADDIGIDDFQRYIDTASDTASLILANCERAAQLIRSFKQVAVDRTSSERREYELGAYVRETLASLSPSLRQAGHSVAVDCPVGIAMDGYPGALSQILTNLVMNSVTHGYDPGVSGRMTISVGLVDSATVQLVYADDGKGIPDKNLGRIFDPFFTTRRGAGGTGLGLHIVFNLVKSALAGNVTVDSPPGQGTTFTLTFPRVAPKDVPG